MNWDSVQSLYHWCGFPLPFPEVFIVCVLLCFLPKCLDQKSSQYNEVACKLVMHSLKKLLYLLLFIFQCHNTLQCNDSSLHFFLFFRVNMLIHCLILFTGWIFISTHLSTCLSIYFTSTSTMQCNHSISITPHTLLTEADLWLLSLFSSNTPLKSICWWPYCREYYVQGKMVK